MALGAGSGAVVRMIMGQVTVRVGLGLADGLVTALLASRFLESQLYQVRSVDPVVYALVAGSLAAAAALAAWVPARRAAPVDPAEALREE